MLEAIRDRAAMRSTIVASQIPIEHWRTTLSDPTVASAIVDRLVRNPHSIALRGNR